MAVFTVGKNNNLNLSQVFLLAGLVLLAVRKFFFLSLFVCPKSNQKGQAAMIAPRMRPGQRTRKLVFSDHSFS